MVIFIDTNILISAALSSKGTPFLAFKKAITLPNKAVICQQNIDELRRIFSKKFPNKMYALEIFIADILENLDVIEIPTQEYPEEQLVRDVNDREIMRAAIKADADIILTGDKDFLESKINKPVALTPSQFLAYCFYECVQETPYYVHDPVVEYHK